MSRKVVRQGCSPKWGQIWAKQIQLTIEDWVVLFLPGSVTLYCRGGFSSPNTPLIVLLRCNSRLDCFVNCCSGYYSLQCADCYGRKKFSDQVHCFSTVLILYVFKTLLPQWHKKCNAQLGICTFFERRKRYFPNNCKIIHWKLFHIQASLTLTKYIPGGCSDSCSKYYINDLLIIRTNC